MFLLSRAGSRAWSHAKIQPEMASKILWLSLLTMCVAGSGCDSEANHPAPDTEGPTPMVLKRGIAGEPASLDPGKATDTFSFEVIRDLYEGLIEEAPDGTILPGVAMFWTVDASGTQYTFTLRPTAKWSNGKNVRAADFVAAWRRVVDPAHASPVADTLRPIKNATKIISGNLPSSSLAAFATRDNLLVVQLEQPTPYFPQLLTHTATFPIYSEAAAETHIASEWISNGPYLLEAWTPGSTLRLKRNPYYWDQANVGIPSVEYDPNPDEYTEYRKYRAGQLDVTESVPVSALASIRTEEPSELLTTPILATAYYALNLRSPLFSANLNLRKSLAMAIDRKALEATILPFGQQPAYGFVPSGTWNYHPQSWDWRDLPNEERIKQSKRLYALAGYSAAKPLRLRVLINSNKSIKQVAIAIASMWRETLGIETDLIDEEYRVFLDSRKDIRRWEVTRLGWTADYNDASDFLDTLRSRSPNNDSTYVNGAFEELLDRAASTPDIPYRQSLLEKAEKLMLNDYPILPIYFFSSARLIKPYIKGAKPNPLNRLYSRHLTFDRHSNLP